MQVTGQNLQPQVQQAPHNNYNYVQNVVPQAPVPAQYQTVPQVQTQQRVVAQQNIPQQQVSPQYNPQYCAPQYAQYPQMQPTQNYQVPASASGVNIQIFNPSVTTPGTQATYNVNAPSYPANYYTGQMGQTPNQQNVNSQNNSTNQTNNTETKKTETTETDNKKKTEKKEITQLTDEYIMNLENYLNNPEKEIRLNAAKEVFARLEEDETRKDDKALTALINKMLQDPKEEIRVIALTALESRIVTGDDFTVNLLKNMQTSKDGYGQDAVDATNILLKMSGKKVEKEVPVKETSKKTTKTETKKESSKA